ncbi:hypothetical protein [uncultured Nocardioides sp.]|uniref:hypothetical protein n=1 Tax=uncultured Nocardioides sp. TaxID=198441 RepID=UPI00263116F9|nr:hypothetical protein [uncultured Nocardioides sp.]
MSPENPLRDLLEREAASAPPIAVPTDTWRRGRRRRALKRAGSMLVAAAVVGGVALGSGLLPGTDDRAVPPADSGGGLGLPDHLHAPPERMSDVDPEFGGWMREEVLRGDELAVGPAAAAWVTPGGLPVVVDAETGEHHLLDLPHVVSANLEARTFAAPDWQPLALSPDGARLAYGTVRFGRDGVISGIRVLDLITGEGEWHRELAGGAGIVVTRLSWSPSATIVAWQGRQTREWTGSSVGGSTAVVGFVSPDAASPALVVPAGSAVVASDRAGAYIATPTRVGVIPACPVGSRAGESFCGAQWQRLPLAPGSPVGPAAALSGEAGRLAVSGRDQSGAPAILGLLVARGLPFAPPLDFSELRVDRPNPDGRTLAPLGWIDDDHLLMMSGDALGSAATLSVVAPASGATSDVGVVDGGVGIPSVAIDLVTLDRPTVERPDTRWPWSEERWAMTVAAAFAAVLLLLLLLLARDASTRRPSRTQRPRR